MVIGGKFNRWLIVIGALLIQMSLGSIYIYSVFKPALKNNFPDWSNTDLALPAQVILAFFSLSMIISGRIHDRIGPRTTASIGAALLGLGLAIASFANSLLIFTLGFGVLGGLGIGAAYVCPIASCVKWFPDKRGLITGLSVAGFGAGGLVFTPIANYLIATAGIMPAFLYLGLIFFVAILIGARFLANPPADYCPAGWKPAAAKNNLTADSQDFAPKETLRTRQFWLLWFTYFSGCTAGLLVIMNITNIWQSISAINFARTLDLVPAADFSRTAALGSTAVIVVSVLNSLGRITWGKISDSLSRKKTLLAIFLMCGLAMFLLNFLSTYPLFIIGVSIIGFCFGGFLALYPAITADYFGTKNVGSNYGLMFSAYGAGGLFGPWLAPKLMAIVQKVPYEFIDKSGTVTIRYLEAGNYVNSFMIAGGLCIIAAILTFFLKHPQKSPE